jgi:hypothetical protein
MKPSVWLFLIPNLVCISCSLSDVTCRVVGRLHHPSVLVGAMSESIVSGTKDEREREYVCVCVCVFCFGLCIGHPFGRPANWCVVNGLDIAWHCSGPSSRSYFLETTIHYLDGFHHIWMISSKHVFLWCVRKGISTFKTQSISTQMYLPTKCCVVRLYIWFCL